MEARSERAIVADDELTFAAESRRMVSGIVPVASPLLIAEIPKLGHLSRAQDAEEIGLVHIGYVVGNRRRKRAIGVGGKLLRHIPLWRHGPWTEKRRRNSLTGDRAVTCLILPASGGAGGAFALLFPCIPSRLGRGVPHPQTPPDRKQLCPTHGPTPRITSRDALSRR